MKRTPREMIARGFGIVGVTLVLLSMTIIYTPPKANAQAPDPNCPEQTWLNSADVPFAYDPNLAPNVLGFVVKDIGVEWSWSGYGCDPDGNAMVFTVSKGVLQHPTPDTFTLRSTQQTVGVDYIHITVADVPPIHQDSIAVTGTVVVLGTRANRPPVLCGGRAR